MSNKTIRLTGIVVAVLGALVAVLSSGSAMAQSTRYVAENGVDVISNDCTNASNPCRTIQFAHVAAVSGDTIQVAAGVYDESSTAGVTIWKAIDLVGAGPNETFVQVHDDPDLASSRVMEITAGALGEINISDLTIRHGKAVDSGEGGRGGGIYNRSSHTVNLSNVEFDSNRARVGGGFFNTQDASATFDDVYFKKNVADERGGAIYNWTGGSVSLSASLVNLNEAGIYGGGLFNSGNNHLIIDQTPLLNNEGGSGCGALAMNSAAAGTTISNVVIMGNSAGGIGGAVCLDNSSPTFDTVNFTDNSANTVNADGHGGGMRSFNGSSPTLLNVTFTGNHADGHGGGMYNASNSAPVLTRVEFVDNVALEDGGGMANVDNSNPALVSVNFTGNTALWGGGMSNIESNPELLNVVFEGNVGTPGFGGGMSNVHSSPELTNVRFISNTGYRGGGMNNWNSFPELVNVIFTGNVSLSNGGGMASTQGSAPLLWSVSFNSNEADRGGAIYNADSGAPVVYNSIFWENTASTDGNEIYNGSTGFASLHYSLHADGPNDIVAGGGLTCSDCVHGDPKFSNPAAGNLQIVQGSAAIDAGDPATDLSMFPGGPSDPEDLAGKERVVGAYIDIGAFEALAGGLVPDEIFSDRFEQ